MRGSVIGFRNEACEIFLQCHHLVIVLSWRSMMERRSSLWLRTQPSYTTWHRNLVSNIQGICDCCGESVSPDSIGTKFLQGQGLIKICVPMTSCEISQLFIGIGMVIVFVKSKINLCTHHTKRVLQLPFTKLVLKMWCDNERF